MSASRTCLLAAAVTGAVLATHRECHAQAYGARAVVEHNDLRWFEPRELDLDGQMPRDEAGFFFTFDKLMWWTSNPKVEIGHPGLIVDSEQFYNRASNEAALVSLNGVVNGFSFITNVREALAYGSVRFATFEENDPTISRDDTDTLLSFNDLQEAFRRASANPTASLTSVAELSQAIDQLDSEGTPVRVGGAPSTYGVRNGIRDALPDAGFAWGERIEFGYSDGERGWMLTILDGPEARSGGVYGAGEGSPYTSQSGTSIYGPDPFFLGDLVDDDGDGLGDGDGEQGAADIFALGFGSVAVNFNLPTPDFLTGFRDYNNGQTPFTTSGPIMYVGNVGAAFNDVDVTGFTGGAGGGGGPAINVNTSIAAIDGLLATLATPGIVDPGNELAENFASSQYEVISTELTTVLNGQADPTVQQILTRIDSLADLLTAGAGGNPATPGVGNSPPPNAPPPFDATNNLDTQTDVNTAITQASAIRAELVALNSALAALAPTTGTGTGAGTGTQTITTNEEQRLGDDLNGNGAPGFIRVVGPNGEIVGTITDFGDSYSFNVFYDDVTVRNTTEIDGVELMRTKQISTRHRLEQGRFDDMQLAYGVRFLNVEDDFFMQGRGSILGRTTVETQIENQIIGPQLGLTWVRRDGPWDFVLQGRGTLGYNRSDVDQNGVWGEEAIGGALNRSAVARTTTSVDGFHFDEFSPIGELRAQLRYRLAGAVTLQAGYTAKYIGNVHRGGTATAWNAPDFGVLDESGDIFINGLTFGVELRH